jgi:hypothetical protein
LRVRIAALLVAVFAVIVGIVGIAAPDLLTAIRRQYFATPIGLYSVSVLRAVMGIVVIVAASTSRAPKTLRVLGAVMCLQGLTATVAGPERARAILEWEVMQGSTVLRAGAAMALAVGGLLVFAVTGRRVSSPRA